MHQIVLLGRATKDAEELTSKKDTKFTKLSLAVNEYNSTTKEETSFFYDVLIFGKPSEKALELVKKGDTIMVTGRPSYEAYLSKKDNEAKYSITVTADSWKTTK